MKKIPFNSILKTNLLLFGISLLLWNCRKEKFRDDIVFENFSSAYKQRTISLCELSDIKKYIDEINPVNGVYKTLVIEGAILDQDNVLEVIDTLKNTIYSLRFTYPNTPAVQFYNLVIGRTPEEDFKKNDCLYSIYTKMGNTPTFANYLKKFDGEMSVANLKLSSSTNLPNNVNAETSTPHNYLITITFNENNLNRPNLSIVRTFIHEMIHADIFRKLLSIAQHPSIQLDQNQIIELRNNYPGLYDYYLRWKWNIPKGQNPSSPQHEAMAKHYRDIIKQVLTEFDDSQTAEVYEALAWNGLQNTVAWNNLSPSEINGINQTINTFKKNNPNCQ